MTGKKIDEKSNIYSYLDNPVDGGCFVRILTIQGWAFSVTGEKVEIDILMNNELFDTITITEKRDDVKTAFVDFNINAICGFKKTYQKKDIIKYGETFNVAARIKDATGHEKMLGPVIVQKVDSIPEGPIRANYGLVWDAVAKTEETARHSVSGFANLDEYDRAGRESVEMFKSLVGIHPEDIILEIGCGVGRVGRIIAPLCKKWIGTDASKNMLKYAEQGLLEGHKNIELIHTNGFDLSDVESETVDFVYSHFVFMHIDEWDRYIYVKEAYRILKPGGKVYIDNINLCGNDGWNSFITLCEIDPACRPPNISKTSTPEELYMYLEKGGFKDIKIIPESLVVSGIGTKP